MARGAFSGATLPLTVRGTEASCATREVEHAEGYTYIKKHNLPTKASSVVELVTSKQIKESVSAPGAQDWSLVIFIFFIYFFF